MEDRFGSGSTERKEFHAGVIYQYREPASDLLMRRLDCHEAIKQVERNYQSALQALRVLVGIAEQQPSLYWENGLNKADLDDVVLELHDIYFIKMFAAFERILRDYWVTCVRNTKPPTEVLIASIAGKRKIPQDVADEVQIAREYRNYLVHEDFELQTQTTIRLAIGKLNTYIARLPAQW